MLRPRLLPLVFALLGTVLFHRFSLLSGLDWVQADTADSRFVAFLLEHWNNAWHGRADWRSPPIFWPVKDVLAYSDMLLGMGALHAALRWQLGLFEAVNAQLVLLTLATFAAAYAFYRRGCRLSVAGATLGAAFFAFSWPRFAQLVHLQLQFTPLLPLVALFALEILRDGLALSSRAVARRGLAVAALLALQLATTPYYAIFLALGLVVALLLCLSRRAGRAHLGALLRARWAALLAGVGLFVLLAAPIATFYAPVSRESGGRAWAEVSSLLPQPTVFMWMGAENWVWGRLFALWPQPTVDARWAEFRIGAGLAASLVWVAATTVATVALLRRRLPDRTALCVILVTGLLLQLIIVRLPHGISAWWLVWRGFPGASGLRAVARMEIVVTLAMGLAGGWALDLARRRQGRVSALATVLVAMCAIEQVGWTHLYSGRRAEALSARVGAAMLAQRDADGCRAAFIVGTPDMVSPTPPVDEAHFDAPAYLRANPDVAAVSADPWLHYRLFGRAEHRPLTEAAAQDRELVMRLAYNATVPIAAALSDLPVVNGLSGWTPPGWNLADPLDPDAPAKLRAWLTLRGRPDASVCTVPIRLTWQMVPFLPDGLWPRLSNSD